MQRINPRTPTSWLLIAFAVMPMCSLVVCLADRDAVAQGSPPLIGYLQSRIAANPNDASSWRMLGRLYAQSGQNEAALHALERAVSIDPGSAAAHFDFAFVLRSVNQLTDAADHFTRATELAPDSEYAQKAREHLTSLPPPRQSQVMQAGYEIKQFDGLDQREPLELRETPSAQALQPLSFRIEGGALYNTNVALTPTSRGFFTDEAASVQGFLNPDLEYRLVNGDMWRAGPTFVAYLNVNENAFSHLNLQSYQPGLFVERTVPLATTILVPRLQYTFTHDEFAELTFGNRHALTLSATSLWDCGDTTFVYWSGDYTNFADDGSNPVTSSRDGWTNTAGASHTHYMGLRFLSTLTGGTDLQYADTDGTDFAFMGVSLYASAEVPLAETWSATLDGSWGYRDYFRSDLVPSRNEHIWGAGARLRKRFNLHWSLAAVFNYNRFDSANEFFNAQRFLTGLVTTFEY